MKNQNQKHGVTLIEVVLSMSILIIILTGTFTALTRVGIGIGKNASSIRAIDEAETFINDALSDDSYNETKTTVEVLGTDVPVYYVEEDIENFLNTGTTRKIKVYKNVLLEE